MDGSSKGTVAAAGSVLAALGASACCLGPLVLGLLGISGAASATAFEPLRPYLLVTTYALLAVAFYTTYRSRPVACAPGQPCARPRASRLGRVVLWIAAFVVVLASIFPRYSRYLF